MMNKISSPVLAPSNNEAVYQYKGQLMLLDDTFTKARVLLDDIDGASHIKWSSDGLYVAFILNGQLKVVTIATAKVEEAPLHQVSRFEWGIGATVYVTANEGALYEWSLQGEEKLLLEQASIEAYSASTNMAIVKRNQQLFAVQFSEGKMGEWQQVTPQAGRYGQAAFSFTGQYVAYIGETSNQTERHVYVYDFTSGITQNLTEMLDVYAGDAMSPHTSDEQGVKEIQWIETDALYFLLSSDGDVRLYYADLFGSVFPASPESEHIVSYSIAKSGNWTLYVSNEPLLEAQLDWFDITMGQARTIVSEPVSMLADVGIYYEIVEAAGSTYYMWGYIPSKCTEAIVVMSGEGRMLGNGYDDRLVSAINENKAIIYVNHPGAIGYGTAYANEQFNDSDAALQGIIESWLTENVGQTVIVKAIVK